VANAPDGNNDEQAVEAKASKPTAKKARAKKPVAKKVVAKKPTAKKPAAKKPAATKAAAEAKPSAKAKKSVVVADVPRMKQLYRDDVVEVLTREFGYQNTMQVPQIAKIVLNIGLGEALDSNSAVGAAVGDLQKITGQKPTENRAKVSIANFKLREGSVIGSSVTLRGIRMWQFYDRFVNITLPRVRDFRGISRTSFDGRGNYSLGMRDQSTFPEIDYNEIDRMRGLQLTFVTTANSDEEGRRLLELLGMPFARVDEPVGAL
jgi:large subunit ribosomal protein L5|tara:strand:- start:1811 stop:2596 length:786 start_codon:yes stop_codon:yes gene_type:complete